ncbi:uncharacterized protein LOC144018180 [Festucalex cinctus]
MDSHTTADVRQLELSHEEEAELGPRRIKVEEEEAEIAGAKELKEEEQEADIGQEDVCVVVKLEDEEEEEQTGADALRRPFCKEAFTRRQDLVQHAGERKTERKTAVTRHPTSQKDFACGRMNLPAHARTHAGEKAFACVACRLSFSAQSSWLRHVRAHAGHKPFACGVCGKRFARKAALKEHAAVHTGDQPFSCSVCSAAFGFHSSMLRHVRTHAQ